MNNLFEYAILYHPLKGDTVLIRKSKTHLAKNTTEVAMIAARLIPNEFENYLDRIEILVRTFKPEFTQGLNITNGTTWLTLTPGKNSAIYTGTTNNNTQTFNANEIKTI